ncbi:MAG: PKD domain-containing protein, partial [Bacteroidota bacterium]
DPNAGNYDPNANLDDNSCTYPEAVANFSYSLLESGCGQATYQMNNLSTDATGYQWVFGYGTPASSTEENPTVTFPTGMDASVSLLASNSNSNNTMNGTVNIPLDEDGTFIKLVVQPDCWGSELGWTLKDDQNNVIESVAADTYPDEFPSQSGNFEYTFCLPDGCYTIDWTDTYGDGFEAAVYWSCDEDATYHFEDASGNVIHQFDDVINWGYDYTDSPCVSKTFVWKGYNSDDWNTASNWVGNVVPGTGDAVIIDTETHSPMLSSTVEAHNLVIEDGKTIDFLNNSGKIKLTGDFVLLGSLDNVKGLIEFKGSEAQYIKGQNVPNFYRLKINTTDSVRLLTDLNMRGAMIMTKGVFDWNQKNITLLSNETTTGSIGEIKNAAEIVGDSIYFQRYYPAAGGSWRMLCSPIKDATFEQWNDDFPTTGFPGSDYPTYPSAQNPWANIREYDETFVSGDEGDMNFGFQAIDNITDVIGNEKGYFVYFIPGPTLIDMHGEFLKGDQGTDLDFSVSDQDPYNDGWNLIANPYPSAIDWDDELGFTKEQLNDAIYAYDPILGQYSSYVNGISIGALDARVASGQAFWVKSKAANPSFAINEKAKTNASGVFMRSSDANTETTIRIRLEGTTNIDEAVVGFNDLATNEFDGEYDAYKFYASNTAIPSIALIPDSISQEKHAISMIPVPEEDTVIPLEIRKGADTDLMLSNVHVDTFDDNICLVLEDRELGTFTPFNEGDVYPFVMSDSSSTQRFALHLSAPLDVISFNETCPDMDNGVVIAQGFGDAPWNFVWKDELDNVIHETTGSTVPDQMEGLTPGFYLVEVTNNNPACNAASKVVHVQAAPPVEMEVFSERATCNQDSTGSIEFELGQNYEWNIEIQDDDYNEVFVADDASGTLTVNQLGPETYHLVAIASCGLEMGLDPIDLSDANALTAEFTIEQETYFAGESVYVTNNTENISTYSWDFGDGFTDNLNFNPVYQYEEPGTYTITFTGSNGFCEDQFQMDVIVEDRPDEDLADTDTGIGAPSVGQGVNLTLDGKEEVENQDFDVNYQPSQIIVTAKTTVEEQVKITVFSISGQIVIEEYRDSIDASTIELNTQQLAPGVFYLQITTDEVVLVSEKFLKS